MHAAEHLESVRWAHPSHYAGFSPIGDFLILSRHRDSAMIDESNWRVACRDLHAEAWDSRDMEGRPNVYHWRAGHSLCGWVEYLCVRADAPDDVQTSAGETVCSLASYPVLSDDDLSERECAAIEKFWAEESPRYRLDLIERSGAKVSMFAARRRVLPDDDEGRLFNWIREIVQ